MVVKIKKPALECEQINLQGVLYMKKMKFEMMNEVFVQYMTFHNMQDLLGFLLKGRHDTLDKMNYSK